MAEPKKTAAQILEDKLAKLAAAQKEVEAAKLALYADTIDAQLADLRIPALFEKIKATAKGADDITILLAIGKAAGIKNLTITTEAKAKSAASTKPKSDESKALTAASVAANTAKKALTAADAAVAEAKAAGKKTNELAPLVEAAKAAKVKADDLVAKHATLKAKNKAERDAKKAK